MDFGKLARIKLSFDPIAPHSQSARELLKLFLGGAAKRSNPGLKVDYDLRSDLGPSRLQVILHEAATIGAPSSSSAKNAPPPPPSSSSTTTSAPILPREVNMTLDTMTVRDALRRIQTAIDAGQFDALLRAGRISTSTTPPPSPPSSSSSSSSTSLSKEGGVFRDRWSDVSGRRPKMARIPSTTVRFPHRLGANPWRLYGPSGARHEAMAGPLYVKPTVLNGGGKRGFAALLISED